MIELKPIITTQGFTDINQQNNYYGPKPIVLIILDGWGIGPNNAGNAISRAQTPNMDTYWLNYPHGLLAASGTAVGLPEGEDGNTETGHLNIGAGTIVYQSLPRIDTAIADQSFFKNPALLNAINHAKTQNSKLHLLGLVGDGEVHSSVAHLYALLEMAKRENINRVIIHCFTDGRDSPPHSGINKIKEILTKCQEIGIGFIGSLMGRYYAMDRDQKWDRIALAYHALTLGEGQAASDPILALQHQYDNNNSDEFIEPILITDQNGQKHLIEDNDAVIFFNFRVDRPRELSRAFTLVNFETNNNKEAFDPYSEGNLEDQDLAKNHQAEPIITFKRKKILTNLYFTTMTQYEKNLPVDVAFPPQIIDNPLCKIFSDHGLRQLKIAETEKERFVTYYLNGQKMDLYPGEDRIIFPSKGVKSYDEAPEMSALEITSEMIKKIQTDQYDVIIANLANPDMVGHTGNLEAAIRACEITDECLGKIVTAVNEKNGVVIITGDHGNVEEMINNITGEIDTEHSTYPVPLILIGSKFANNPSQLSEGILSDVAPTILSIMGIDKPDSMTGRALI